MRKLILENTSSALAIYSLLAAALVYSSLAIAEPLIGHDYSYHLSRLLAGVVWARKNGLQVPYYQPYFCGLFPSYGNPQSMFYSIPQLLTYFFPAWTSIKIYIVLLVPLVVVSTNLLLKRVFIFSSTGAAIGTMLFCSNGFFQTRMTVGHLNYANFALLPTLLLLLLDKRFQHRHAVVALAILCASFIYGGSHFTPLMLALSIPLTVTLLLGVTTNSKELLYRLLLRGTLGGILGFMLAGSKLVAVLSVMKQLPRKSFFNEVHSFGDASLTVISQLFLPGAFMPFKNSRWEWDTSLPPIALIGLVAAIIIVRHQRKRLSRTNCVALLCFFALCLSTISLSTGFGSIDDALKSLPAFAALRTNMRFLAALMLPLCIVAAWGLGKAKSSLHAEHHFSYLQPLDDS